MNTKRFFLLGALLCAFCLPAYGMSDGEYQILHVLQDIKAQGLGGGSGASDVTIHDQGTTSRFLGINASGQVGISNFPTSFTIGAALPAGANVIGGVTQGGTWTVQPGNTANTTAWKVDGSAVNQPVSQNGTWTVQPGNTANTTAWKVDGSAVTQPVSAASLPLPSGAATSALQNLGAANVASSHVTASTSAATLAIARSTRRSCLFRNLDASINVWIGPATVTSGTGGNGMLLKPGESVPVTAVTLWQVVAESGSPIIAITDEYN